jgi:hypothetical protein
MDTLILLLVHSQLVFSQEGFVLKKEAKAIKVFVEKLANNGLNRFKRLPSNTMRKKPANAAVLLGLDKENTFEF